MPFVFIDKKKIQPRFRSPTPNLRFALVNTPFHSRIKCSPDCLELNVKIKNGGAARCAGTPRKNCIYRSRENIDCHFLCVLSLFFPFFFRFFFSRCSPGRLFFRAVSSANEGKRSPWSCPVVSRKFYRHFEIRIRGESFHPWVFFSNHGESP